MPGHTLHDTQGHVCNALAFKPAGQRKKRCFVFPLLLGIRRQLCSQQTQHIRTTISTSAVLTALVSREDPQCTCCDWPVSESGEHITAIQTAARCGLLHATLHAHVIHTTRFASRSLLGISCNSELLDCKKESLKALTSHVNWQLLQQSFNISVNHVPSCHHDW